MTNRNSAFRVVDEKWMEEEKRALTYEEFVELFYTRLNRLDDAQSAIERQVAQNQEARMRLRREALEQAAQAGKNDELYRILLPDMSDKITRLIDSAMDFLNQLYAVAEERPAISPEMQANVSVLVNALTIPPALIRSALIGIDWPIQDRLNLLADLSLKRDLDICKHNNTLRVEEVSSEDENNTNTPA